MNSPTFELNVTPAVFRAVGGYATLSPESQNLMATCPRCKGHLTDSHLCPKRPSRVAAEVLAVAILGGFAGLLLVAIFDPHSQTANIDTFAAVSGALIAVGINRALRA